MLKNQSFDDRRHSTSIAKLSEVLQPQKHSQYPAAAQCFCVAVLEIFLIFSYQLSPVLVQPLLL
jgi:hypothetical protein